MAINSLSGATAQFTQQPNVQRTNTQQANPQQVRAGKDADGDRDGTKPGQVEKAGEAAKAAEAVTAATLTSSTLGSNISTRA